MISIVLLAYRADYVGYNLRKEERARYVTVVLLSGKVPAEMVSCYIHAGVPDMPASQWTVEGQGSPPSLSAKLGPHSFSPLASHIESNCHISGRAASPEGTRIHQRLRESSEKVSCVDTALTKLDNSADQQRRFQVETREHTSSRAPSRVNSASSPPAERADSGMGDAKSARTDTQETGLARRTSVQTRHTSIQIREPSTHSERTKTKRTATRQNSIVSVIGSLNLRRTTSPEPMGPVTACGEGNCMQVDGLRPDVVCDFPSGLDCEGAVGLWLGQISLAATHDPEEAYEGADGYSMTKVIQTLIFSLLSTDAPNSRSSLRCLVRLGLNKLQCPSFLTDVTCADNDPHPTYYDLAYKLG